jgi:hypothetical protein
MKEYFEEWLDTVYTKGTWNTLVYYSTSHSSQVMETTKMPYYWQMDQENVVFIHNGILLSHEEEWNLIIRK